MKDRHTQQTCDWKNTQIQPYLIPAISIIQFATHDSDAQLPKKATSSCGHLFPADARKQMVNQALGRAELLKRMPTGFYYCPPHDKVYLKPGQSPARLLVERFAEINKERRVFASDHEGVPFVPWILRLKFSRTPTHVAAEGTKSEHFVPYIPRTFDIAAADHDEAVSASLYATQSTHALLAVRLPHEREAVIARLSLASRTSAVQHIHCVNVTRPVL
jgi:hypothetical protein